MLVPTRVHRFLMQQEPLEAASRDLGQLVDRIFNNGDVKTSAIYAVDVREDVDHIYVEAELPGFQKENMEVTLEKNVLTITADRKTETAQSPEPQGQGEGTAPVEKAEEPKQQRWLLRERQTQRFQRSFRLPPTVADGQVEARYAGGVLYVTLNKREESKPRKIAIG